MPSFDIVSKVDVQLLDNAVNTATKEVATRYDFRDSKSLIELDKKNYTVTITTENEMKMDQLVDLMLLRAIKQGLDAKSFDLSKDAYASGNMIKKEIQVKNGIDKETGKKIVKIIKDGNLKVQPAIMDDQVRVTGKKIDDLQTAIAALRRSNLEIPLQFVNMKS